MIWLENFLFYGPLALMSTHSTVINIEWQATLRLTTVREGVSPSVMSTGC